MVDKKDRDGRFSDTESRRRLEQRRAFRLEERRRRTRRNRTIAVAVAVTLIVAAIIISPWGPLKGSIYGGTKAPKKVAAQTTTPTRPAKPVASSSSAASSSASSGVVASARVTNAYLPVRAQKVSVTKHPTVAIVIDDTGNIRDRLPYWTAIDAPLTFAVMPYPPLSKELADKLYLNGYDIFMHTPTDNMPPNSFAGTGQLATGMSRQTVFQTLDKDILNVPHAIGMNNHMGGRGCDQLDLMTYEVEWAKSKGLVVVDSASSVASKVTKACLALGLPKRLNEVFIDHQNEPDYIRKAMRELASYAKKNGTAIGICHWHRPNTATVVGEMIKTLRAEGINFAFAKDITD